MKILVTTAAFRQAAGGTPESLRLLASELEACGVQVDVIASNGVFFRVGTLQFLPDASAKGVEASRLRIREYAALFIAGAWNIRAIPLALKARALGKPVLYASKGTLCRAEFMAWRDFKKIPYFFAVELFLIGIATRLLFTSHKEIEHLRFFRRKLKKRGTVIPEPFFPPPKAQTSTETHTNVRRIGFMAEISPRKGLLELIQGFVAWHEANLDSDLQLIIAGTQRAGTADYLNRIKRTIAANGLADKVQWIGSVKHEDRAAFYKSLDLFVVPSRFESFGLTPLEALSCGTPVLCGSEIGVLEFLAASDAVYVLKDLQPESFVTGLNQMLTLEVPRVRKAAESAKSAGLYTPTNEQIGANYLKLFNAG